MAAVSGSRSVSRATSWFVDWGVVAAWLGVLTAAGFAVRAAVELPAQPVTPSSGRVLAGDAAITGATVVPYLLYLVGTESSAQQGTLGKRVVGLVVTAGDGQRARPGQIWGRNLLKALPWELAHLGVSRAIYEVQTPAAITFTALGTVLGAACAVPSLLGRRGLHDVLAGTRVLPRAAARGGRSR